MSNETTKEFYCGKAVNFAQCWTEHQKESVCSQDVACMIYIGTRTQTKQGLFLVKEYNRQNLLTQLTFEQEINQFENQTAAYVEAKRSRPYICSRLRACAVALRVALRIWRKILSCNFCSR